MGFGQGCAILQGHSTRCVVYQEQRFAGAVVGAVLCPPRNRTSVSSSLAKLKQYCKCPQTHTARGCGVLPPHSDHTGHDLGRGSWPEAPVCPWWSRGASAWAKLALPSWPLHSTGSGVGSRLCAALPRHTRPGGPGCMIGLRGWRLGYLG